MNEIHESLEKPRTLALNTNDGVGLAVFDGIGGSMAGEKASYIAANTFGRQLMNEAEQFERPELFLQDSCFVMNREICREAKEQRCMGMGTTAAMLYLRDEWIYICNLGDSPVFRLRDHSLQQISREHTDRKFLEMQGIMNRKPAITQYLGVPEKEMRIQPYIDKMKVNESDQFLICSDGLTDMMTLKEIEDIMLRYDTVQERTEKLMQTVLERGARDNTTMILLEVQK